MKIVAVVLLALLSSLCAAQVNVQCPALPCDIHVTGPVAQIEPITVTPLTLTFQAAVGADSPVLFITIKNNTIADLPIQFPLLTGSGFLLGGLGVGCQSGKIPAGTSCTESVKWHPITNAPATGTAGIIAGSPAVTWTIQLKGTISAPPPPVLNSTLWWVASTSAGVTGYNLYRSTLTGGPYTLITSTPVTIVPTMAAPYRDLTAVKGTAYFYVATALKGTAESLHSNEVRLVAP